MKKIRGEYTRVSHWSCKKDIIDEANKTPINIPDALALVRLLEDEFLSINMGDMPKINVRFKLGAYGMAYYGYWKLVLPATELPYYGHKPIGYLRVGVVIHEVAHLVAFKGFRERNHGKLFVDCLDMLMEYWYSSIRIEQSTLKAAGVNQ